jgi:hypothetical protein
VKLRIPIKTGKAKLAGVSSLSGAVSGTKRVAVRSASLAMATAHGSGNAGGDDASFEEF